MAQMELAGALNAIAGTSGLEAAGAANAAVGRVTAMAAPGLLTNPSTKMKPWRDALARVRKGGTFARVVCLGTSSTYGWGPTTPETEAWVPNLASNLAARTGLGYRGLDILNNFSVFSSKRTYITPGSGWVFASGSGVGEAGTIRAPAGTVAALQYTDASCDRFTIWYHDQGMSFNLQIDSDSVVPVVGGNTNKIVSKTVTAAGGIGSHTLKVSNVTAANLYVMAIEPATGTGGIRVANCGVPAATSANFVTAPDSSLWTTMPFVNFLAPELIIVQVGLNDQSNGVTPAAYQANLTTLYNYLWDNSPASVVALLPFEWDSPGSAYPTSSYRQATVDAAAVRGLPTIDLQNVMFGNTKTYDSGDGSHLNKEGHWLWARSLARIITDC